MERPRLDLAFGAIGCVLGWLAFAPFASLGIDPFHDGLILKPALDVAAGQTLFRDTLMVYGALATWLQALALGAFGETLLVLRFTTVFAYGLIAGTLVLCWRLVLPRPLTVVAFTFWFLLAPLVHMLQPWPSVYALCFQSLTLLALMYATAAPGGAGWALASGVLAGLTFLTRQFPTGFFTCVGVLAAFAVNGLLFPNRRPPAREGLRSAGVGMALVLAIFLLHLLWHGSLEAWWQQTVVWAAREAGNFRPPSFLHRVERLNLWWRQGLLFCTVAIALLVLVRDGRRAASASAIGLAVVGALLMGRSWLWEAHYLAHGASAVGLVLAFVWTLRTALRTRSAPSVETVMALAALIVCLGSWSQAYPLGDPAHVFWALSPALGFILLAAWQVARRNTALVVALFVVLWAPFALAQTRHLHALLTAERVTLSEPALLAGMRVAPNRAEQWAQIAAALREYSQSRPRWTMLLEGINVLMLGLAPELTNPDPYFMRYRFLPYDAELRARFILRERPLVFRAPVDRGPVDDAMQAVGYVPVARYWDGVLLVPRQAPAGTATDGAVNGG